MLEVLASGSVNAGQKLFGSSYDMEVVILGVLTVEQILEKAERAQPKPTADNPLYANFGKKRKGRSMNITRFPL